ncbi:lysine-specific demethylase 4C-like [Paramacrobiotus metropolitanus]|uniref:lysine-specific demethylase 4C-like n=1 Tax=Paramacrobiotus metropolitanus TaxID=2943436 RepID=UPI0024456574|nr:lysine-specific demethylase 4C-like [Paramacrobiotus metropolitanus]
MSSNKANPRRRYITVSEMPTIGNIIYECLEHHVENRGYKVLNIPPQCRTRLDPIPAVRELYAKKSILLERAPGCYFSHVQKEKVLTYQQYRASSRGESSLDASFGELANRRKWYVADIHIPELDGLQTMEFFNFNTFSDIFRQSGANIPGFNTSTGFIGAPYTYFGYHVEVANCAFMNMHHGGKPKRWNISPPRCKWAFDNFLYKTFPEEFEACGGAVGHLNFVVEPDTLRDEDILVDEFDQEEGDLIISAYGAYHAGINSGFCINTATAITTPAWIPAFAESVNCHCDPQADIAPELEKIRTYLTNRNNFDVDVNYAYLQRRGEWHLEQFLPASRRRQDASLMVGAVTQPTAPVDIMDQWIHQNIVYDPAYKKWIRPCQAARRFRQYMQSNGMPYNMEEVALATSLGKRMPLVHDGFTAGARKGEHRESLWTWPHCYFIDAD